MNQNEMYVENYESITEDLKYISNSVIRLKILATLYEKPFNMKELNDATNISYSSISSNMHNLELKGFVFREANKYYLSNDMKLHMGDILELNEIMELLNTFFNILDGHIVDIIPNESIAELFLLGKANLIESSGVDVYKINNYIKNVLKNAKYIHGVLPFNHKDFNRIIIKNEDIDILVPSEIYRVMDRDLKEKNIRVFRENKSFLLIITDCVMLIGLFKNSGQFDQNRLLTSRNADSIKWAKNLFENFKKKYINES